MTKRLLVSYLLLTAIVLVALEVPLGVTLARRERDTATASLTRDAVAVATISEEGLEHPETIDLRLVAERYEHQTGERTLAVVSPAGTFTTAAGDDRAPHDPALQHEVDQALKGTPSAGRRQLAKTGQHVLFAASPIGAARQPRGAVLLTSPAASTDDRIHRLWLELSLFAVGVLGIASLIGFRIARSVTRPLAALGTTAERLGHGELDARAQSPSGPPELRALADSFNAMADRLGELIHSQQAFAADASHQLRTPLTALRLRLENLEPSVSAEATADLEAAIQETQRLARLVDGLLTLARAEGTRPTRIPIDLNDAIDGRRIAWQPLTNEQDVTLRVETDSTTHFHAWVVPGHLDQILDNLLANALEATPAGKGMTISLRRQSSSVEIRIEDRGHGMSNDERQHAFDRFWQSDRRRGSGLGLAISQQLAKINHGEITLLPATTGGTIAVVTLEFAPQSQLQPSGGPV